MTATIADVLLGRAQWTVLQADCLDVLPCLPDRSVAHVITDPPYSAKVHSKQWVAHALSESGDRRTHSEHKGIDFEALSDALRVGVSLEMGRAASRWSLVFCDVESIHLWAESLADANLDYVRTCLWDKVDSAPQFTGDRPASACEAIVLAHPSGRKRWNGGGRRNLFQVPTNGQEKGGKPHPTQKPVRLMLELVELFTDPGEVILDPFAGSGTTGVACLRLGRRFIGIERDEKYAAIARERLAAETQGLSLRDARAGQMPLFGGAA